MDRVAGDKVVWIITLLLMLLSIIFIFSSSSRLTTEHTSRLDIVKDQLVTVAMGLGLVILCYNIRSIEFYRKVSSIGFVFSLGLLLTMVILHKMNYKGFISAPEINGAVRFLKIKGLQLHVFEVVKVAMVMYISWAVDKLNKDEFKLLNKLSEINRLGWLKTRMAKKAIYLYIPFAIITLMVMTGSNTAAVFIAGLMIFTICVGTGDLKEVLILGAVMGSIVFGCYGVYSISKASGSEHPTFSRIGTAVSRLMPHDYARDFERAGNAVERQKALDKLRQPYSARIAVKQGVGLGKGPGQSTQRYVVPDMPEDYMFSFILEEYGFFGGLLVMILYISLLARGVLIVKNCDKNLFAQCAVFGLVLLISGQAFIHMVVNCDIGILTGQTLPMLSHGASAFLCFSIAFGIILAISRISNKKVEQLTKKAEPLMELHDSVQAELSALDDLDTMLSNTLDEEDGI